MPGPSDATPVLALPYPSGTDAADAPTDMRALVDRIEELLLGGDDGAAGVAVGALMPSARPASHGRWLLCDTERELTQAEIESELGLDAGQADEFVTLLGTGATSKYGAAAAGKVTIPGFEGVVALGASADHPLRSSGGEETHTLTIAEIPAHGHAAGTLAAAAHTHGAGTLAADAHHHGASGLTVASHSHAKGTLATDSEPDHSHGLLLDMGNKVSSAGGNVNRIADIGPTVPGTPSIGATQPSGSHSHDVNGNTGNTAPAVNGNTGAAGADVSGATGASGAGVTGNTASAGGGQAFSVMQPWRAIGNWFIRV